MRHWLKQKKPCSPTNVGLAGSLAVHFVLAALLLQAQLRTPEVPLEPEAVLVEIISAEPQQQLQPTNQQTNNSTAPAKSSAASVKGSPEEVLSFSALAPSNNSYLSAPPPPRSADSGGSSIDELSPYAPSGEAFAHHDKFGAIHWAHRKIQYGLGYPEPFIRNGIAGNAEARFTFNSDGLIDAGSLEVRSDSPYLRVYVHRLIERTFAGSPVPPHLRKWRDRLELLCFVRFSLVESQAALSVGLPTPIVGNRLFFARQSAEGKKILDKLRWQVGPVHGMFPIPAVGVDMTWFARQAERPKIPVDELAPWREDPLFYN